MVGVVVASPGVIAPVALLLLVVYVPPEAKLLLALLVAGAAVYSSLLHEVKHTPSSKAAIVVNLTVLIKSSFKFKQSSRLGILIINASGDRTGDNSKL